MNATLGFLFLLFGAAWALIAVMTPFYLYYLWRIHSRLRDAHPDVYRELGCPTIIGPSSVSGGFRVMGFLLSRRYELLGDALLQPAAARARFILVWTIVATSGFFLVLHPIPGNAARIFRKKYSSSRKP